MKKTLFTLLTIVLPLLVFGQNDENAVSMVSYEQSWLDYQGTLALRNNTDKEIYNLTFVITYLDMSGNELDYEEFTKTITIAPGMTKKVDIPAYEHQRSYHYYKSENSSTGTPAFKIKFQLKDLQFEKPSEPSYNDHDYNTYETYETRNNSTSDNESTSLMWLLIIGVMLYIGFSVGLYILVAIMAQKRNRNIALWVLVSIFASPLLIIIILLCIGKDEKEHNNYIK